MGEALTDNDLLSVATVGVESGEAGGFAQIFGGGDAEAACSAGGKEPGNADAVTFFQLSCARAERRDSADNLVARDDGQLWQGEVALDDVQVGVAYAAAVDMNDDFTGARDWLGEVTQVERAGLGGARFVQQQGSHEGIVAPDDYLKQKGPGSEPDGTAHRT